MINFSWSRRDDDRFLVFVKTPLVRAGTFNRLTTAIYALNLSIVSGNLNTLREGEELYSVDEFLLENADMGAPPPDAATTSARLGMLMESLLREEADPIGFLRDQGAEPPPPLSFFEAAPEIVFQDLPGENVTQFYIETLDRSGLLYQISSALYRHDVNIIRGTIHTAETGMAEDTFFLQYQDGCLGPELSNRVQDSIENAGDVSASSGGQGNDSRA